MREDKTSVHERGPRRSSGRGGPRRSWGTHAVSVVLVLGVCVFGGVPLWDVAKSVAYAIASGDASGSFLSLAPSLVTTIGVPALIGLLACVLAVPGAVLIGATRRSGIWSAFLFTPMLMPSYLAFAGWGIARSPDTLVGKWITTMGQEGHRWVPVWSGYVLSVLALALWVAPLPMLILAVSIRRRGRGTHDLAVTSGAGLLTRTKLLLREHARAIGTGFMLVWLVMIGSAVPLHLAQLQTHAIVIWRELMEREPERWGGVWIMCWPLLLVALLATVVIVRKLRSPVPPDQEHTDERERRAGVSTQVAAVAVFTLAVLAPLALFAWSVREFSSLHAFWQTTGRAVVYSLQVAGLVGLVCASLGACVSLLLRSTSRFDRLCGTLVLGFLLAAALSPGIMIGAAIAQSVLDGTVAIVTAHVLRFGAVGALVGAVLVRFESASVRGVRALDGADGVAGWLRTVLPREWGVLVGTGLIAGLLSLHEIESAVLTLPPGPGNLARWMLDQLHFMRMEAMSAGSVQLIGAGLIVAIFAAFLLHRAANANRGGAVPEQRVR